MVERLLECQEKVNNPLERNFRIILTNIEMLPCKILRERTIDLGSLFSKEKEEKEVEFNFTLNLRIFPDHQIRYRDMKIYFDTLKICEKRKLN